MPVRQVWLVLIGFSADRPPLIASHRRTGGTTSLFSVWGDAMTCTLTMPAVVANAGSLSSTMPFPCNPNVFHYHRS